MELQQQGSHRVGLERMMMRFRVNLIDRQQRDRPAISSKLMFAVRDCVTVGSEITANYAGLFIGYYYLPFTAVNQRSASSVHCTIRPSDVKCTQCHCHGL